MNLGYLGLCFAGGLLWADADRAHLLPGVLISTSAIAMLVVGAVFVATFGARRASRESRRRGIGSIPMGRGRLSSPVWMVVSSYLVAGVFAFDAGSLRLESRLADARRDRVRAEALSEQGAPRRVEARVAARRVRRFGDEVELVEVRAVDSGAAVPERVLLRVPETARVDPTRAQSQLWPGTLVRLALHLSPIHAARNPGGPDRERAAWRRGFAARARLVDPDWVVVQSGEGAFGLAASRRAETARITLRSRIAAGLVAAGDESGLVRALALGDRSGLSTRLGEDFRKLGLSHLLAVSGLHVGLLATLLGALALRGLGLLWPRCSDPFAWAIGIAITGAGAYAWLVGGSVSVERAWCVLSIGGLLVLRRRAPRPIELLAAIALAVWVSEPASFFDLGAELSFAACLGLVAAGIWRGPLNGPGEGSRAVGPTADALPDSWLARARGAIGTSLRVSCAAGFGTAFVLAQHGLSTAWPGPVVNAIAVPAMGLLVLPSSLLAALGVMWAEAFGPLFDRVSNGFLGAEASLVAQGRTGLPGLDLLVWPAETLARFATWVGANLPVTPPVELGLPIGVGLASLLGLASLRLDWRASVAFCWMSLVFLGGTPRADPGTLAQTPRVWFFDVGQGDAALVEGREHAILIDSGPGPADGSGGKALVESLRSLGRRSVDVFVVTHADLDHRGGAGAVLEGLSVGELWVPGSVRTDPDLEALAALARKRGVSVRWQTSASSPRTLGDLDVRVLWPPADDRPRSRNAGSLVVRVEVAARSFLFLADVDGDIEAELVARDPERMQADYLKVSHHGSRGGTTSRFLEAVAPRHAFLSGPCLRTRGLPSSETLARIRRATGTRLWWTGRDGAIAVFPERAAAAEEVVAWGAERRCPE